MQVIQDVMVTNLSAFNAFAEKEVLGGHMTPADRQHMNTLVNEAMATLVKLYEDGELEVDMRPAARGSGAASVGARGPFHPATSRVPGVARRVRCDAGLRA